MDGLISKRIELEDKISHRNREIVCLREIGLGKDEFTVNSYDVWREDRGGKRKGRNDYGMIWSEGNESGMWAKENRNRINK